MNKYVPLERWLTGDWYDHQFNVYYGYDKLTNKVYRFVSERVFMKLARRDHLPVFWKVMCELMTMPAGRHAGLPLGGVEYQRQLATLNELSDNYSHSN